MIKVKQTETYYDSGKTVCKGKLVLTKPTEKDLDNIPTEGIRGEYVWLKTGETDGYPHLDCYKPIIISEIETYNWNELVYDSIKKEIVKADEWSNTRWSYIKILAMPENFSLVHLKAIVGGKLKDGDDVFIECDSNIDQLGSVDDTLDSWVKLTKNQITLFPVRDILKESIKELNKNLKNIPKEIIDEAINIVFGTEKTYTENQVIDLMHEYNNRMTGNHRSEKWQTEKWFKENSNKIIKQ